jgi:hypothetical protein
MRKSLTRCVICGSEKRLIKLTIFIVVLDEPIINKVVTEAFGR